MALERLVRRPTRGPLLERDEEIASLAALLDAVTHGEGRLALIEGPAGIGKSRLLAELRGMASENDVRTLSARGGQLEQEFPFGVVRQLFEPALVRGEGSSLLVGAALAAGPVFEGLSESPDPDAGDVSFAALHGLYWLTANLAAERPLSLVIDDLHWADRPSLRYLAYLVRRLEGFPVLVCAARRPAEPGADAALLAELASDPLTVSVHPSALTEPAAREVVRHRLGEGTDDRFTTACHKTTGGNPLLLHELLKAVEAEGVRPEVGSVDLIRELGPRAASRAVLVRLARLSPDAAAAARAAAVLGEGVDLLTVAGLAGLTEERAARATAALAQAEILRPEPPLGFVHPLVRDAVYFDLPAGERALAHAQAARLLTDRDATSERVAAHLLLVAPRDEPWVVAALEDAAQAAMRSGGPENAAAYLRRALEEALPEDKRSELVLSLGMAEASSSAPSALEHLRAAYEGLAEPARRAQVAFRIAWLLLFVGSVDEATALLRRAVGELPAELEDERQSLEALHLIAAYFGPADGEELERLRSASREARGENAGAKMLLTARGYDLALQGEPADRCVPLALEGLADRRVIEAESDVGGLLSSAGWLTLIFAEREEAETALAEQLDVAHRIGSLSAVMAAQLFSGFLRIRRGDLREGERLLLDTLDKQNLWGRSGATMGFLTSLGFLAQSLIEQGRLVEARAALERVGPAPPVPSFGADMWRYAHAELLLAESRAQDALGAVEEAWALRRWVDNPAAFPWRTTRARALDMLGRTEEALAEAEEELPRAREWGTPGAIGRTLRVRGTLKRENGIDDLEEAVGLLEGSMARLELAKALAALGTMLRLARRPTDAREPLRRGLDLAEACGASALAERTRSELYASGARPRGSALSGVESLTASERRVVDLAAEGKSNRDIAQALYVTPKTVEVHLSNAYRKLEIGSRRELAGALADSS